MEDATKSRKHRQDSNGLTAKRYFTWYKSRYGIFAFLKTLGISCRSHLRNQHGVETSIWSQMPSHTIRVDMRWRGPGGDGMAVGAARHMPGVSLSFPDAESACRYVLNTLRLPPEKFCLPESWVGQYPTTEDLDTFQIAGELPYAMVTPATTDPDMQLIVDAARARRAETAGLLSTIHTLKHPNELRFFENVMAERIAAFSSPPQEEPPTASDAVEDLIQERTSLQMRIQEIDSILRQKEEDLQNQAAAIEAQLARLRGR